MLAALLILLVSRAKTKRSTLLYSAGTGMSLFLFQWWYDRSGFVLAFFVVLVAILFIHRIRIHSILLSALLFVLFAHPGTFMSGTSNIQSFLEGYISIEETGKDLIENENTPVLYPNTMTTISEVDKLPMEAVLRRILSNTTFGWVGFVSFLVLALLRWRFLLPLVPMLALGLLSFQSSNRFIMYLAPFIGIGLGWMLNIVIDVLFHFLPRKQAESTGNNVKRQRLKRKASHLASFYSLVTSTHLDSTTKDSDNKLKGESNNAKDERLNVEGSFPEVSKIDWFGVARQGALYLVLGLFFWLISGQTAISFVPGPSIHTGLYATFLEVKKRVPENSALLTWWDYGYAITDAIGMATFHDGGSQKSPKTYFIARGLISDEPEELYDITQYLATEGNLGIAENNSSPQALLEAVRNPKLKPWDPIYLFFTVDMTGKFGAISKLGSWDIENGGSKPRAYQNLACNKITNHELSCQGAKIDIKAGFINNRLALHRLIFIRNGKVIREQKFGHNQGYTLQLIVSGNNIFEVQLIDEEVFRSNYNQMFLLGRYRKDLFEETYNAFPFSRLYRIKF